MSKDLIKWSELSRKLSGSDNSITWNLINDNDSFVIHIISNYKDEYVKLKNGNIRRFKTEDSAIDWFAKNEDKFIK